MDAKRLSQNLVDMNSFTLIQYLNLTYYKKNICKIVNGFSEFKVLHKAECDVSHYNIHFLIWRCSNCRMLTLNINSNLGYFCMFVHTVYIIKQTKIRVRLNWLGTEKYVSIKWVEKLY